MTLSLLELLIAAKNPTCKSCGEENIERVHLYFQCEKVSDIGRRFLQVLKVFDPQYSPEDIINLKGKEEHPQLYWFIANTLFYIDRNKRRCNSNLYRAYMRSEYETLRLSRFADYDMKTSVNIMIELLEDSDEDDAEST